MLAVWSCGVSGGMMMVGQNRGSCTGRAVRVRRQGIHGGSSPRAHLRHVAHVPTHVFDALHAVPQVAHEAVTVPYEREDRDHRRHRVRWIGSVKAGQPAGWHGRGGSGPVSSRVPHSRDGQARTAAEVHCLPTALPSSRSRCALPLPASARRWVWVWHSAGRLLVARRAHPVRWHAESKRTLQVEQQLGDHGGVLRNARHASTDDAASTTDAGRATGCARFRPRGCISSGRLYLSCIRAWFRSQPVQCTEAVGGITGRKGV